MVDMLAPGECEEDPSICGHIIGAIKVSRYIKHAEALTHPDLSPWVVQGGVWDHCAVVKEAIEFDEPIPASGNMGLWTAKSSTTARSHSRLLAQLEAHGFDIGDVDDDVLCADLAAFGSRN